MIEIEDYFKQGILSQVFQAKRNLFIWESIADEVDFLTSQKKEIQQLYGYIQSCALTNCILDTAKLFDNPNKKYPTRCILSFLELINDKVNLFPQIIETIGTIEELKRYQCPIELIDSADKKDSTLFPLEFYNYFKAKYQSVYISDRILTLKAIRDKVVAHNEVLTKSCNLDLQVVKDLLVFALEIISIFAIAYYSATYTKALTTNVEINTYFIIDSINDLKEKNLSSIELIKNN